MMTLPENMGFIYKAPKAEQRSGIEAAINRELESIPELNELPEGSTIHDLPKRLSARLSLALNRYRRPVKGVHAWLNPLLGPLPTDARIIDPTKEAFKEVKSYWLFGFLTSIGAMGLIFGLATLFPFLRISPLSLVSDSIHHFAGDNAFSTIMIFVALFVMFHYIAKYFHFGSIPEKGGMIAQFAMAEEQWFRMGSESWTLRQRIQSCVIFGIIHVQNLFYPVTSLIVVGVLGGVLMAVYQHQFRKTGDYRKATLASARLHTVHNYFSFLYLAIVLMYVIVTYFTN